MDDRFNTIAGWVLGGGIVLLGGSLVAGEYFKAERPEHMGYPIAGVVEEGEGGGAAAEPPVEAVLQTADVGAGEASFRKCTGCHNATNGGADQVGPNLWGVVGGHIGAHRPGYAYSEALRSHGGEWTFQNLYQWLKAPGRFAQGTKMTFAGLSDPQERANVIAYLNQQGSNLPLPPPPAAAPAEGNAAAPAEGNAASPAENAAVASDAPARGGQTPPPGNSH